MDKEDKNKKLSELEDLPVVFKPGNFEEREDALSPTIIGAMAYYNSFMNAIGQFTYKGNPSKGALRVRTPKYEIE